MNKSGALQKAPLLLSKKVLPFRDRKNILILDNKYIPIYNADSGQAETMQVKWARPEKNGSRNSCIGLFHWQMRHMLADVILGFVENWKNQGGDQILKEINEELNNISGN